MWFRESEVAAQRKNEGHVLLRREFTGVAAQREKVWLLLREGQI